MRAIDRVRAIQAIVGSMEDTMGFEDIRVFFEAMDMEAETDSNGDPISGTKRDIIRSYIDTCPNAKLIDIAEQFGLGLNIASSSIAQLGESEYWLEGHFRVFISHVHTEKVSAANLKGSLQRYGITCFVAHEDIATSDEWRDEILKCLNSMDAMVTILSGDFGASKWCDQEVGFAVCRDVLIVPLNKGVQPYGFIEKYQAYPATGRPVGQVAQTVFETLAANRRTREILADSLVRLIPIISQADLSIFRLHQLNAIGGLEKHHWEKLRNSVQAQSALSDVTQLVAILNPMLASKGVEPVTPAGEKQGSALDDKIPF